MRLSADARPAPAHHHKWTAQLGAPFHREANAYDAPPSPGMGTSTTFERSRTGDRLPSGLFRTIWSARQDTSRYGRRPELVMVRTAWSRLRQLG